MSADAAVVPPRLSVVVLSRHRPQMLDLCLTALCWQDHPEFEVILVADPETVGIRPELSLKRIAFDEANISAARNLGIRAAGAGIIAFIDDDALALPGWASRLARAFADPHVVAATGFTRGPDGLRWQARAERLAPSGETWPLAIREAAALPPLNGCPVSTIGTNCAFRRDALLAIGGFDPVFRYHLDESDVNMRMAAHFPDALTAIVPEAEVIHGIAAGPRREDAGVPGDLTAVGRSGVIFARRFGGTLPAVENEQKLRLLGHIRNGRLDPCRLPGLLASLRRGQFQAVSAPLPEAPVPMPQLDMDFQPFGPMRKENAGLLILDGWHWQAGPLRDRAARAAEQGQIACILLLTPTIIPHRLTMMPGGWWEQRGGIRGGIASGGWRIAGPGKRSRELRREFRTAMTRRFGPLSHSSLHGYD